MELKDTDKEEDYYGGKGWSVCIYCYDCQYNHQRFCLYNGSCLSQIKGHFDSDYLQGWKSNSGKAYYDEENTIFPEPEESVEKSVTKEKELTIIALPRKILWQ